jgi:hypothetical protein
MTWASMWTAGARAVGNRTGDVERSPTDVDERPANVGERGSTVDVAARRAMGPFHNM